MQMRSALRDRLNRAGAACVAVLALAMPAAAAEENAQPLTPALLDAILRVEARVPPEARTARNLGTERRGSGVLIDDSGLIVTIGYLIMEAQAAEVTTRAGKPVLATIIGFDNASGLGLLRATEPLGVKPLHIGRAENAGAKTTVLAASAGAVQPATIVARRTFAGYWEYLLDGAIFTAPPLPDWSGAALIAADGRLIGIGSLLLPDVAGGGAPMPGNMFVPIDRLEPVLADLLTNGRPGGVPPPWLGLTAAALADGVVIVNVSDQGPAEKAGLSRGDRVLAVAGKPVKDLADFYRQVWAQGAAGIAVPLTIEQAGERREVRVQSIDRYKYLKLDTSY